VIFDIPIIFFNNSNNTLLIIIIGKIILDLTYKFIDNSYDEKELKERIAKREKWLYLEDKTQENKERIFEFSMIWKIFKFKGNTEFQNILFYIVSSILITVMTHIIVVSNLSFINYIGKLCSDNIDNINLKDKNIVLIAGILFVLTLFLGFSIKMIESFTSIKELNDDKDIGEFNLERAINNLNGIERVDNNSTPQLAV